MMLEKQCLENSEVRESIGDKIELKNEVTLENVSFSYRDEEHFVMKNLNLQILAGKTTAIVGPSGAGKSTVADLSNGSHST